MWWSGLLVIMAALAEVQAEKPELIPREVLFGNPKRTAPQVSHDGKWLAYVAPSENVQNVWVRTIGSNDDRVITSDDNRGIFSYDWHPDSAHILYRKDRNGNEEYHLYQTNIATKKTRDLTPFEGVSVRWYHIDVAFPDRMLITLNKREKHLDDVFLLDLNTGEVKLDTKNPGNVVSWMADHRLEVRAAGSFQPDGGQKILFRHSVQSPWETLQEWGPEEPWGGPVGFSPDDKGVRLLSSLNANTTRLLEVDLGTGKTKVLAEDPHYDVRGILMHPRNGTLRAVSFCRARLDWQTIDKSIRSDFDTLNKVRDGDLRVVSTDYSDRIWIVSYTTDDGPHYYYAYNRASQKASFLFSNRPELERYQFAKMKPISFTARDGMALYGYLTMPAGVEKNAPAVLLVHGGPWTRDRWGFNALVQMLANRGYAVMQVNFRGSSGYGKEYRNAGDKEWGGKMHLDLVDGKWWAVKQGYIDPDRVAIMGYSYGGYATLVGLTFTPEEFACGVDISGPSDLVTHLKARPSKNPLRPIYDTRVGNPEKDVDLLKSRSPLFRVDKIKSPLLIGHGANDPNVKKAESDQIVRTMRNEDVPVEYVVFPDEGHWFAKPDNRLRFMAAVDQFLAKYLGGRSEPPSEQEDWHDFLQ